MPMDSHEVTATIRFESTFTVDAKDAESAERKVRRMLESVDLFEAVEGRSPSFELECNRNDVHRGGPMNTYSFEV